MDNIFSNKAAVADCVDIEGNAQATLAVSTTAQETATLPGGLYDVWATADVHLKVGSTTTDVTTSTGYFLKSGNTLKNLIIRPGKKLGGIAGGATTISYHRVG